MADKTYIDVLLHLQNFAITTAIPQIFGLKKAAIDLRTFAAVQTAFPFLAPKKGYRFTSLFVRDFTQKNIFETDIFEQLVFEEGDFEEVCDMLTKRYFSFMKNKLNMRYNLKQVSPDNKFFVYFLVYFYYIMNIYMMGKSVLLIIKTTGKAITLTQKTTEQMFLPFMEALENHLYNDTVMRKTIEKGFFSDAPIDEKMESLEKFMRYFSLTII